MKKINFFAILVSLVLITISCKNNVELKTVSIGTFSRAIDYSPFYIAKHFKWFENSKVFEGKKIKYSEFNDRESFAALLERNELNAIFAAEPPMIITKAQGVDIKIAGISCTLQQEILIRNNLNINTPHELKGSKIAVLAGTSSHYGLMKILKNNNVAVNEVNIQFMGPNEARIAFESDIIDGWAVWPPFVEQQQVNGNGKVLKGGDAIIQSVFAIPQKTIVNYPEVTNEIISIIDKAKKWIEENPDEAISIVANELDLDIEVVRLAWPKHFWSAQMDDTLIKDIQEKTNFLKDEGATRNGISLDVKSELIYSSNEK